MTITYTATYSPEDNKLRLYPSERLPAEVYEKVKAAGFSWAPVQKLFVAPKWTPSREDLCIELAGDIHAEESTMVERAQAKAERLERLAAKNVDKSDAFANAARRISERFESGQPILVGHHSERKARKDQQRMESAVKQAQKCAEAVHYWNWKAEGVEAHANYKAAPGVRARRIETLLKELRDYQRDINHGFIVSALWEKVDAITDTDKRAKAAEYYAGAHLKTGATNYRSVYSDLVVNKITANDVIEKGLKFGAAWANSESASRSIQHALNRLAYERAQLPEVEAFTGDITPVILQTFARTHGAHKPEARKEDDFYILASSVPLPCHIGDGLEVSLTADEWRALMKSCGYSVPVVVRRASSKPKAAPLVNPTREQAEKLQAIWNAKRSKHGEPVEVLELTQAQYTANSGGSYSKCETHNVGANGERSHMVWQGMERVISVPPAFRVRVTFGAMHSPYRVIVITDAKQSALPVDLDALLKTVQGEEVAA